MEQHFKRALKNISMHGDTDVFPYPIENAIFYDCEAQAIELLQSIHQNFHEAINTNPPLNESQLSPVGYTGFRWVTQLDPIWNAYFLALVISAGELIESARIPAADNIVHSYRYIAGAGDKLFDQDYGWRSFHQQSLELAKTAQLVVTCDISDFYPRARHHRLENALQQLPHNTDMHSRINTFLSKFTGTNSHGLPVGGPAARLLSELLLNRTDTLLRDNGIKFCRFADDYHLFANSEREAYDALVFLSEKLLTNEGLTLQKAKTKIVTAAEFRNTSPLTTHAETKGQETNAAAFLSITLRFDPYSPTADADYQALSEAVQQFDIIGLLRKEVAKSQIDISVTRQIVKALKFLDPAFRDQAVVSVCDSIDHLYPIFPTVIMVIKSVHSELADATKQYIGKCIRNLFSEHSRLVKTKVNISYACRLLGQENRVENVELLVKLYNQTASISIKGDIILIMFNWRNVAFISDVKNQFVTLSPPQRRAVIVASYALKDEGEHWRTNNRRAFTSSEILVRNWAAQKAQQNQGMNWQVPI